MLPTNRREYIDHLSNIEHELTEKANIITQIREHKKKMIMNYLNIIRNYMK